MRSLFLFALLFVPTHLFSEDAPQQPPLEIKLSVGEEALVVRKMDSNVSRISVAEVGRDFGDLDVRAGSSSFICTWRTLEVHVALSKTPVRPQKALNTELEVTRAELKRVEAQVAVIEEHILRVCKKAPPNSESFQRTLSMLEEERKLRNAERGRFAEEIRKIVQNTPKPSSPFSIAKQPDRSFELRLEGKLMAKVIPIDAK